MDRLLKLPADNSPGISSGKGPAVSICRKAAFGKATFYADSGKLFCRPCYIMIEHACEKNSVERHLKTRVNKFLYRRKYWICCHNFQDFCAILPQIYIIGLVIAPRFSFFLVNY